MKRLFAFLVITLALASCKLTQRYQFNLDLSGDYKLTFDVSELALAGSEPGDTIEDFFADINLDSLAEVYRSIDGLSKVSIDKDTNVLKIAYNFRDLDALNSSLKQQDNPEIGMGGSTDKFTYEDGVFSYTVGTLQNAAKNDSLSEMMDFISYDISMHFAKKIKEASNGTISDDERSVKMEGTFGDVLKKEKSIDVNVQFKTFADEK